MLIQCERHTPRDIEHWSILERADRLNGLRLARGPKPSRAIEDIRSFAAAGPCYVSTSWGKDSVVVCHLAVISGLRLPVVHIVQLGPQRDPYQSAVRDAFLSRYSIDYHEIEVEPVSKEQRENGHAPQLDVGISRARERFGTARWIGGLRADESGVRKLRAMRGLRDSCWPIRWWSAQDVFGYLAHHDLPIHPAYAMTRGGVWDRDQLRVSIIGGKKGRGHGREEWERTYYPDIVGRLAPTQASVSCPRERP